MGHGFKSRHLDQRGFFFKNRYIKSQVSTKTACDFIFYAEYLKILSASIIDGSYYAVNNKLVENIKTYPTKYKELFSNVVNIKILNYLADCNRMDTTPYRSDYALLEHFDEDCLITGSYKLTKWISNTSNNGDACAFIGRKPY